MYDTGPDFGETRGPIGWGYGLLFGIMWITLIIYGLWHFFFS